MRKSCYKTLSVLRMLVLSAIALSSFVACAPENEKGLEGSLLFQDQPLAGARVEIYLKAEKDRSVQPFAVATTDKEGRYQVDLPEGQYYVIGKKRDLADGGRSRMLMAESPTNPVTVTASVLQVASFNLREMGREGLHSGDATTGVAGQVTLHGEPVPRAYVYVYNETEGGLIGPSYGEAIQTGRDGRFTINLPAGRYSLVARKRVDGGRSGVLAPGDLKAHYPDNPVEVTRGEILELNGFALTPVDAEVHAQRKTDGIFTKTDTALSGQVVDTEGQPVEDVYVFAYLDSRMVGKPVHMSAPTDTQGKFELYLSGGGTYYVGARSSYGGPLEPGEWIGTYDARPDHSIKVAQGRNENLGELIVREFW